MGWGQLISRHTHACKVGLSDLRCSQGGQLRVRNRVRARGRVRVRVTVRVRVRVRVRVIIKLENGPLSEHVPLTLAS